MEEKSWLRLDARKELVKVRGKCESLDSWRSVSIFMAGWMHQMHTQIE